MPAITPARDLDVLDHITRVPPGEGRHSGWSVSIETEGRTYQRHFPDKGQAVAALQRAVDWRDETVHRVNRQHGRIERDGVGVELGVRVSMQGRYEAAVATLPATADGKRQRVVRTINAHGYHEAIRQACQFRFDGMRERLGDDYPFATVEDLIAAVTEAEGVAG